MGTGFVNESHRTHLYRGHVHSLGDRATSGPASLEYDGVYGDFFASRLAAQLGDSETAEGLISN